MDVLDGESHACSGGYVSILFYVHIQYIVYSI